MSQGPPRTENYWSMHPSLHSRNDTFNGLRVAAAVRMIVKLCESGLTPDSRTSFRSCLSKIFFASSTRRHLEYKLIKAFATLPLESSPNLTTWACISLPCFRPETAERALMTLRKVILFGCSVSFSLIIRRNKTSADASSPLCSCAAMTAFHDTTSFLEIFSNTFFASLGFPNLLYMVTTVFHNIVA